MAGIAGIFKPNEKNLVNSMLETISHRGEYGKEFIETSEATIGMIWSLHEDDETKKLIDQNIFRAGPGFGHQINVLLDNNQLEIKRGHVGVVPLYLAITDNNVVCFASEVKALLPISKNIVEFSPGQVISHQEIKTYFELKEGELFTHDPLEIAKQLQILLSETIQRRINNDNIGIWLSGGLDSSSIAALAKPFAKKIHSFSGGVKDAPDLLYARQAANFLGTQHHEVIIDKEMMLKILPDVIYHLESFDTLSVRSSIINLCVAWAASDHVSDVFTGDGGDELFGGNKYLKDIPASNVADELIDSIKRLHNTVLQRVDRTASAFGLTAHVIFMDSKVVDFAMRIPVEYKINNNIEKWILREAMKGLLPESILTRSKTILCEGSGVETIISNHANTSISDYEFSKERNLKNGWIIHTKEELYYYRIFKDLFGEMENLDWMGRSKNTLKAM